MEYMYELKDKLCKELDEIARKPEMGAGDLEIIHKLTDTIKNLDKIEMLEDGDGYSQAGDRQNRGNYSRNDGGYNRGSSYANRGKHYVRGHYSRDGYSQDGRMYSRDNSKEYMMGELEEAMNAAGSEREREIIRRAMSQLEQM